MTDFKQKRKRRTKQEMELVRSAEEVKQPSEGLGDTIEKVLDVTGIGKVAKWLLGEDCGCEERKAKLNKLFKYRPKINCLTEQEFDYLSEFFSESKTRLKPTEQTALIKVYNRIFNVRKEPTNCGQCWAQMVKELKRVMDEYAEANN